MSVILFYSKHLVTTRYHRQPDNDICVHVDGCGTLMADVILGDLFIMLCPVGFSRG